MSGKKFVAYRVFTEIVKKQTSEMSIPRILFFDYKVAKPRLFISIERQRTNQSRNFI